MPDPSVPGLALPAGRGVSSHLLILFCLAAVCALGFLLLLVNLGWFEVQPFFVLLLAVLLGFVTLWPAVISMRNGGGWDVFHPLFYASWFFFLPQFVFASFLIVLAKPQTSTALLLPDPWTPRLAALGLALLGSVGLSLGYFLPLGSRLGRSVPQLRTLDLPSQKLKASALLFLGLGFLAGLGAFYSGLFGYQFNLEVPVFGATFAAFAQLMVLGQGIIWFSFFKERRGWRLLALLALGLLAVNVLASGGRAALLGSVLILLASYQYAQARLRLEKLVKWIPLVLVGLFVGMIFGTYFRWTKIELMGRITRMGLGDIFSTSQIALQTLRERPLSELVTVAWTMLAERIDGVTSLGVILAYAGQLKPLEVAQGMDGNILRDLASAVIPRFLWVGKPVVGVHEQIGNLYFNTRFTSPTVTYMGDLYRNFGIWGVLPGMLVLGIILRSLYVWLLEKRPRTPLRVSLFLLLSWTVNYEALYSTYLPTLLRALAITLVAVLLVKGVRLFTFRR